MKSWSPIENDRGNRFTVSFKADVILCRRT